MDAPRLIRHAGLRGRSSTKLVGVIDSHHEGTLPQPMGKRRPPGVCSGARTYPGDWATPPDVHKSKFSRPYGYSHNQE